MKIWNKLWSTSVKRLRLRREREESLVQTVTESKDCSRNSVIDAYLNLVIGWTLCRQDNREAFRSVVCLSQPCSAVSSSTKPEMWVQRVLMPEEENTDIKLSGENSRVWRKSFLKPENIRTYGLLLTRKPGQNSWAALFWASRQNHSSMCVYERVCVCVGEFTVNKQIYFWNWNLKN